jgi:hypothetical protein
VTERDWMGASEVALVLKVTRSTVHRIPRDQLPYWETPGGGQRRHRRYLKEDVYRYARDVLGVEASDQLHSPGDPPTAAD